MKGESQKLIQFFDGSDKRFCIPLYQRNYDWKLENCRQLFSDLLMVHQRNSKSHFFGSIVSSLSDDETRMIIDGQQRITTVSLILIAMINAAQAGDLAYDKESQIKLIRNAYLVNEYRDDERKVKLKPIKNDMAAFDALIYKDQEDYIQDSNVTRNYRFFYERIKDCGLKLEELLEAVKKLEIINVRLERDDDPQLIFESLNSTGLDLSESDKIRNYLLMSLGANEQEQAYNAYWNKIEIATDYKPTMFIRDYLTIKTKKIVKIENLYFEFKQYGENSGMNRTELMADMLRHANIYNKVVSAKVDDPVLAKLLKQLSYIDSQVHMPFILSFLLYSEEKRMAQTDVHKVFKALECYWARRIICNLPANALSKVFSTLHTDILKHINEFEKRGEPFTSSYPEVMKYVLLKKQGTAELPNDKKVAEEIAVRNVYKMPIAYRYFMFERMNNGLSKEYIDVVGGMKDGTITIEHIMPQTLSQQWKADLGENYQDIYDKYLHTFANLTLSAYNQSYSNAPYSDKWEGMTDREGKPVIGFKDSIYSLSADLKNCERWTETELQARQLSLSNRFMTIWSMPVSSFVPLERPIDNVGFNDDEVELTGRQLSAFTYHGQRQTVVSWKAMLIDLCAAIYREYKTIIEFLCSKKSNNFYSEAHGGYTQFAPGCYVFSDNSTQTKMSIINQLFRECSISDDELSFDLVPLNQDSENEQHI